MERYETYKDSGVEWIGEIPAGWECCALSFVSSCSNGATPSRNQPEYWNGEIPWMASGEVHQGYVTKTAETITQAGLDNTSTRILPKNSVVIALNGQGITKGLSAILGIEACTNQSLAGFICDESKLDFRWLNYCFVSMYGYLRGESGEAQRDGIATSSLKHEKIPLPSITQQRAIAGFLDAKTAEIDGLVADCERAVELLQEYRKAVISEAVTKGLDPNAPMKDSGVEWIGEIPVGWQVCSFKSIGHVAANLQHPQDHPGLVQVSPDRIEKGTGRLLPCVTVEEVGIESDNHLFATGDILYSKVRPALNKVTVATFDGMCSADMYPIKTCENARWLMYYMLSNAFMEQVIVSTDRVKMPKINKEELGVFKIVVPGQAEQRAIVAYLDAKTAQIDQLIEAKRQMIEKLREYRKSLISEAVTGKFKVPGV